MFLYCSLDLWHDTPCDFVNRTPPPLTGGRTGGQTQNTLWAPECNQPPHAGPCNGFPCKFVTKLVELGIYPLPTNAEAIKAPTDYGSYFVPSDRCTLPNGHSGLCNGLMCGPELARVKKIILDSYTKPTKTYYGYEWPYDEETEEEKKMHIDPTVAVAYGVAIVFSALVLLSYFRRDK